MPTGIPTKYKKCIICGKLFLPAKPSTRICNNTHYANCPVCGKQMIWNTTSKIQPCSKECRKENTKRRCIEKYGVDHPMKSKKVQDKHKTVMLEKYGVEHALQNEKLKEKASETIQNKLGTKWALENKDVREKAKITMRERYGGETTLQSETLKSKYKQTMFEKYGYYNPAKVEAFKEKAKLTNMNRFGAPNPMMNSNISRKSAEIRHTNIEEITQTIKQTLTIKYGVDNPAKIPEVRAKIAKKLKSAYPSFKDRMIQTNIERYGVPYYCMTDECKQLQGSIISAINKKFQSTLLDKNIQTDLEYKIENRSYDIHVSDTNILLEINPTYTHNSIGNHWGDGLDKYYHKEKTDLAERNGFRCIHVWDWDNWDHIVSLIKPPENVIYARKCTVYRLNKSTGDEFLKEYHIQGTCKGQLLYLGLVYNEEVVEIMTFGKPRYDKKYDVELLRLCTKSDTRVIGGASKLFSYATSEYGLTNIISYCDKSKFNGKVYEQIGMELVRITPPQEIWSKGSEHITANLLRARGYDQLFGTNYGKGTSNEELMLNSGYLPVYDCGQRVYAFK